jgi:phosphatidate cytidylyltransferase
MKLGNLAQRILFAVIVGPLGLWLLWMGGWWRAGALTFVLAGSAWEYFRLLRVRHPEAGRDPETILPVLVGAVGWISEGGPLSHLSGTRDLAIVLSVGWILLHAFRRLPRDEVFPWVAQAVVGFAYLGIWGSSLHGLCAGRAPGWEGIWGLVFAIVICWVADTSAYAVGRTLGRHKLCPELSPAKTVEGAIGSVVATAAFGAWFIPNFLGGDLWLGAVLGALSGAAAIAGDLAESVLKRWAGVKDSSHLLPGHGGLLDRFDSLFLVAPLVLAVFRAWRH